MGCKQSKSAINVSKQNEDSVLPVEGKNAQLNDDITHQPTSTKDDDDDDDHPNDHDVNKKSSIKITSSSSSKKFQPIKSIATTTTQQQQQQASTAPVNTTNTSTAATTTTTTTNQQNQNSSTNGNSHSTIRSSDRVYKLLLKASQHRTANKSMRGKSTSSRTTTTNPTIQTTNTNTNPLDEKAVLQAMSPNSASYRNPDTQSSPLHLAVQLLDSHSLATLQQQSPPINNTTANTTTNNSNSNHHKRNPSSSSSSTTNSSSALWQVISELIKAYPDAVHTPDIYGYIPLHYAIAPTTTTTTTTSATSQQQQQQSPNKKAKVGKGKSPIPSPSSSSPPTEQSSQEPSSTTKANVETVFPASIWPFRTSIVRLLLQSDTTNASYHYLLRNDVTYQYHAPKNHSSKHKTVSSTTLVKGGGGSNKCSPLYRILQTIPDDPTIQHAPTLEYVHVVLKFMAQKQQQRPQPQPNNTSNINSIYSGTGTPIVCMGNHDDGDQPLALLYRRFTRQFDVSEQFFTGDNSRREVVEHRQYYKMAASNTWKMIELLIQQQPQQQHQQMVLATDDTNHNNNITMMTKTKTTYRIVHRAVQGETPPDLLRYIVETNAEELTVRDEMGNLPLHYAARYRPKQLLVSSTTTSTTMKPDKKSSFPAFYSKYVMDELLYKYPEAAAIPDNNGSYPLLLAVQSGKQWIGGGIKSLYDAYPDAVTQIDLHQHPSFQRALMSSLEVQPDNIPLSTTNENDHQEHGEEKKMNSPLPPTKQPFDIIRDEQHDAIMLVQDENVDISEVVTSMWAHEEDAGVQMLGCIAIRRLLHTNTSDTNEDMEHCLRIALSAVPAVVNAMKAHPNEVIVQEKACHTLRAMASADGQREVSFVASGAVAAIVGAMQAHVSDANVQEEACGALSQILRYGGPDRATVIASVSGLTAMMNAIAAHPHMVHVQQEGCRALLELTNYTATANLPELPKSPTESLLEHAKQMYPKECTETVDVLLSRLT